MKYLYLMFALILFFNTDVSFGQNVTRPVNSNPNYNLPPGYRMHPKKVPYDLSYKLYNTTANREYTQEDLKYLKNISDSELESYKGSAYYNYYMTAKEFIASLSDKVKAIYTQDELWYIYAFDQKLKNTLTTIK